VTQPTRVGCVVVDYLAGEHLVAAVSSLRANGIDDVVVVDNAGSGAARAALGEADPARVIEPGQNLGFGAGANRGVAALGDVDVIVIANPDVVVHDGAVRSMVAVLDLHAEWGIVGPTLLTETGSTYPSIRRFPSIIDAVGHAALGRVVPDNPFTRRYREAGASSDGTADWVSGSCFAIRASLFERLGGFDESYFMFAEDMDLCWRAGKLGALVGTAPDAVVTHVVGVSRRAAPHRMVLEHHRSALRFAARTTRGPARLLLPLAALLLGARLAAALLAPTARRMAGWRARA
jgi:N-acetylglucosaminyl-diphospho-decaprenol L-rhamnosyltransferase